MSSKSQQWVAEKLLQVIVEAVHKKTRKSYFAETLYAELATTYIFLILADDSNLIVCVLSAVLSSYMAMGCILINGGRLWADRMPTFGVV